MKKSTLLVALSLTACASSAQTRGIESETTSVAERTKEAVFRLDATSISVEMRDKKSKIASLLVTGENGDTLDAVTFRPNSPLRQLPMAPTSGKITVSVITSDGKNISHSFVRP